MPGHHVPEHMWRENKLPPGKWLTLAPWKEVYENWANKKEKISNETSGKVIAYPPTPEKRTGTGESFFRVAIKREPMVSPETSPETMKTLSSPSLAAMSITHLLETDIYLFISLENPKALRPSTFHSFVNHIWTKD